MPGASPGGVAEVFAAMQNVKGTQKYEWSPLLATKEI